MNYNEYPGFSRDSITSLAAAAKIASRAPSMRRIIWDALEKPLASEQLAERTGILFTTVRARIAEMGDDGLICDSGQFYNNSRGNDETVWKRTPGREYADKLTGGQNQQRRLTHGQITAMREAINLLRLSPDYHAFKAERILLAALPFLKD